MQFSLEIYGDKMRFSERHKLDKLAYSKFYDTVELDAPIPTFNGFYGTETHVKYLLPLLRKQKLELLKKVSE